MRIFRGSPKWNAVLSGILLMYAVCSSDGVEPAAGTSILPVKGVKDSVQQEELQLKPEFVPIRELIDGKKPLKWLFMGDSITMGSGTTFGYRDYTQLFAEHVRMEMGRKQDIVINSGVSGDNTNRLLSGFDWRVKQFQPDVVFLMVGMNDCTINDPKRSVSRKDFRANLEKMVKLVRDIPSCKLILQTTCPILPGSTPEREPQFEEYMNIIREVAKANACPLVDHTKFWCEAAKSNPAVHYFWMGHAYHPNQFGHRVFAELIFKELGIFNPEDPKAYTCRFFHP